MSPQLRAALAQPDYQQIVARAAFHADTTIRKYIWRGHRRQYSKSGQIMVGDKTAEDFVSEAVLRLADGRRTFDPNRSLLENLNSITDSLISSDKKSSDRAGLIDIIENEPTGEPKDPVSTARDAKPAIDQQMRESELVEDQRRCVDAVMRSFDGDDQMQKYLDALSAGFKRSEISELMDIQGTKVDELRRKLVKHAKRLFGVTSFKELQSRLQEGK